MIEQSTGTVSFPTWSGSLHPAITRTIFLSSALSQGAKLNVKNEPWCSWNIVPTEWDGKNWYISVYFHGDQLHTIHIQAGSPEFGSSWSDWSEGKEMRRKRYHEDVLNKELGPPPNDFPWGTVASTVDPKGGTSSIIINLKEK